MRRSDVANQLSGALGFLANDPIDDGDMFFGGVTDQLSGNVCDSGATNQPVGSEAMATTTPCWEVPADDGIMPAAARAGEQLSGSLVF